MIIKMKKRIKSKSKKCDCSMENAKLSGLLIPAGLLMGIGIGMIVGYTGAGTLIGLGLGFLAAYASFLIKRK
jgi:hypothetical protein